jgi:xylulokinase
MYLGIDLGTSELKLVLLAESQRVEASARVPLVVSRPQPLWSEQAPADWWAALDQAMSLLAQSHPHAMRAVRGIGLSGQMHGAVLLDEYDAMLRPAILWNDGRSGAQCEALMRDVPELTRITGNLAMPGFTAPKLQWVREHEPDVFARTARVLLPKDYLRLRLTGEVISDMSDASGTLWLDVGQRDWSDRMLAATGLTRAQMPRLVEGSAPGGRLRGELARRWGLPADVVVAGGGGDNAASAVGIGAVEPGQGFVSLGTSGVLFVVSDAFRPNPHSAMHAFCHALPGRWHQMSVMLAAASAVDWAARLTGLGNAAALVERAATLSATQRERAPIFLPYLSGERTPHNNPNAQGLLFGLTHEHDAAAIGWAALEGVGFGLLDGLHSLALPAQAMPRKLALVGGGARSVFWGDLLASTLGIELEVSEGNEAGGALGAARLGWLAAGGTLAEVCRESGAPARVHAPQPALAALLKARHARFCGLYQALTSSFWTSASQYQSQM